MQPLKAVLDLSVSYLSDRGVPNPRLDAELLMGHALDLTRVQLYLHYDRPLEEPELSTIRPLVQRRGAREPLAYITGQKEFFGQDFQVQPSLLVPRPDTEVLVEQALARIPEDQQEPFYLADVGCGTGCVGLILALLRPCVRLYSIDCSRTALDCTRENAIALGVKDRTAILRGDLLDPVPADRPIDAVVSNPPYICSAAIASLSPEIQHHEDPRALDGGPDGLEVIDRLVPQAVRRASQFAALEIGQGQASQVRACFVKAGVDKVDSYRDLAGIERALVAVLH